MTSDFEAVNDGVLASFIPGRAGVQVICLGEAAPPPLLPVAGGGISVRGGGALVREGRGRSRQRPNARTRLAITLELVEGAR